MKIFGTNDTIFARATVMGQEIMNLKLSGVRSMDDLLRLIRQQVGVALGMVKLTVRNLTQGWTQTASYRMA